MQVYAPGLIAASKYSSMQLSNGHRDKVRHQLHVCLCVPKPSPGGLPKHLLGFCIGVPLLKPPLGEGFTSKPPQVGFHFLKAHEKGFNFLEPGLGRV